MAEEGSAPSVDQACGGHPSIWLVGVTCALLAGQGVAAVGELPWAVGFITVVPLLLFLSRRRRRLAMLLMLAAVAFDIGYLRHRRLLDPA
ncbi:MAG: hypothetical protein ACM37Z_19670, partial [Deltaproteobacteria bacterium]